MGFMAKHATINIKHVNIASLNSLKDHKKYIAVTIKSMRCIDFDFQMAGVVVIESWKGRWIRRFGRGFWVELWLGLKIEGDSLKQRE
jgi:hypothetical protein